MTLREFNAKYQYRADKNYDDWSVITPSSDGKYMGDCESYILSLREYVDGFSDIEVYFCYVDGGGHCIGSLDGKWIDCNFKELRDRLPSNYTGIRRVYLPELWIRQLKGKILSLVYKDN